MRAMTKFWKYGLISAGAAATLTVALFFVSGYTIGRLPTLPTPPGATVPPGLRYVGGDEFDAPDGSAPDSSRWKINANTTPARREVWIESGALQLSPNGSLGCNAATVFSYEKPDARIAGRIEIRARMANTEGAIRRMQRDSRGPGWGWQLGGIDLSHTSLDPYSLGVLSIGYSNGTPQLHESAGNIEVAGDTTGSNYDGAYHTYTLTWRNESVVCLRDDVEIANPWRNDYLRRPVIHPNLIKLLPTSVHTQLSGWKEWDFARPHYIRLTCADVPPVDTSDPLRLEIDYVRIFQAE